MDTNKTTDRNLEAVPTADAASEIRSFLGEYKSIFESGDIEGILTFYADDVVAFDMMPPLEYTSTDSYRKAFQEAAEMGQPPWVWELSEEKIFVDGNIALVTHLINCGGVVDGKRQTGWIRHTFGLEKREDVWLIVHEHSSVPLDMKSGKALFDLKPETNETSTTKH